MWTIKRSSVCERKPDTPLKRSHCIKESCKRFKFDSASTVIECDENSESFLEFVKNIGENSSKNMDEKRNRNTDENENYIKENIDPNESEGGDKNDGEEDKTNKEEKEEDKEDKEEKEDKYDKEEEMEIDQEKKSNAVSVEDHICEHAPIVSFPVTDVVNTMTCTFKINNLSKIHDEQVTSEPVVMQDFVLKLSLGPKFVTMDNGEKKKFASIYLYCLYTGYCKTWSIPINNEISIMKNADEKGVSRPSNGKVFNSGTANNWGWPKFAPWDQLYDPKQGYDATNDCVTIRVVMTMNNKDFKNSD